MSKKPVKIDYLQYFPSSISIPRIEWGEPEKELSGKIAEFLNKYYPSHTSVCFGYDLEIVTTSHLRANSSFPVVLGHCMMARKMTYSCRDDEWGSQDFDSFDEYQIDPNKHIDFQTQVRDFLFEPLQGAQIDAWNSLWQNKEIDDNDYYLPTYYSGTFLIIPELVQTARNYGFVYR